MQTVLNVSKRFTPDVDKVRTIIGRALIEQRSWLNEDEAKAVLDAYTIPVAPTIIAANSFGGSSLSMMSFLSSSQPTIIATRTASSSSTS